MAHTSGSSACGSGARRECEQAVSKSDRVRGRKSESGVSHLRRAQGVEAQLLVRVGLGLGAQVRGAGGRVGVAVVENALQEDGTGREVGKIGRVVSWAWRLGEVGRVSECMRRRGPDTLGGMTAWQSVLPIRLLHTSPTLLSCVQASEENLTNSSRSGRGLGAPPSGSTLSTCAVRTTRASTYGNECTARCEHEHVASRAQVTQEACAVMRCETHRQVAGAVQALAVSFRQSQRATCAGAPKPWLWQGERAGSLPQWRAPAGPDSPGWSACVAGGGTQADAAPGARPPVRRAQLAAKGLPLHNCLPRCTAQSPRTTSCAHHHQSPVIPQPPSATHQSLPPLLRL
jgi:hypothetical protein